MESESVESFERLIRGLEARMLATIWRILRNDEDVADAHQQALIRIWEHFKQVARHPNPPALVLRICIQASYDELRKRTRSRRLENLAEHLDRLTDSSPSALQRLRDEEQSAEIRHAIAALPRKQALATMMRVIDQQSYAEIAQALGCSEVTARSHVARGRAKLAQRLARLFNASGEEKNYELGTA